MISKSFANLLNTSFCELIFLPTMPGGDGDRFKGITKPLYFIENGPKHYKRIFDVTVLQHEEDMRSHLGQGEEYCKQIHTSWV